jgi:hypothetical protein
MDGLLAWIKINTLYNLQLFLVNTNLRNQRISRFFLDIFLWLMVILKQINIVSIWKVPIFDYLSYDTF